MYLCSENKGTDQLRTITAQLICTFDFAYAKTGFLMIIIIIIIITLFQEDNIFGRVASLTYGPQLTNVGHDIIEMNRHACTIIYSMYRVNALRTPSRLRAGYPTLLQWRGRYDFSRLKTSRVLPHTSVLVIECFLTRSMLFLKCIYTHYIQSFFSPAQYQKRYLS